MSYIGVDLHRRFSQVHVISAPPRHETTRRLPNDELAVRQFFSALEDGCKVAIEATGNWYWLVDALQDMGCDVALSNPLQTKAIARARKIAGIVYHMVKWGQACTFILLCWFCPVKSWGLLSASRLDSTECSRTATSAWMPVTAKG